MAPFTLQPNIIDFSHIQVFRQELRGNYRNHDKKKLNRETQIWRVAFEKLAEITYNFCRVTVLAFVRSHAEQPQLSHAHY